MNSLKRTKYDERARQDSTNSSPHPGPAAHWPGHPVRGWQESRRWQGRVGGEDHGRRCADGCDVGVDTGSPVSPDYGSRGNEFSGHVKGVQLAIAEDAVSFDHLVSPEDAVRIAMARQ